MKNRVVSKACSRTRTSSRMWTGCWTTRYRRVWIWIWM